jgi:hypothetical protein
VTSPRKQRREIARWEAQARDWGTQAGRSLALGLYQDRDLGVLPYSVGVVLWPEEKVWAELPARCSADAPVPAAAGGRGPALPPQPPVGTWLVTSKRIAGRINGNVLRWWTWDQIVGAQVDLTPGREMVHLDPGGAVPVVWTGPGVAPLAVAAVYHLHGAGAMVDHPGLAPLRSVDGRAKSDQWDTTASSAEFRAIPESGLGL